MLNSVLVLALPEIVREQLQDEIVLQPARHQDNTFRTNYGMGTLHHFRCWCCAQRRNWSDFACSVLIRSEYLDLFHSPRLWLVDCRLLSTLFETAHQRGKMRGLFSRAQISFCISFLPVLRLLNRMGNCPICTERTCHVRAQPRAVRHERGAYLALR